MTLILSADTIMRNPAPGTPMIPDMETGLWFSLDASNIQGLGNGDAVESLALEAGQGETPVLLDSTWVTTGGRPTFSASGGPNGGPCIEFDGASAFRSTSELARTAYPFTFVFKMRVDTYVSGGASRILSFFSPTMPSGTAAVRVVTTSSQIQIAHKSASVAITSGKPNDHAWLTVTAVFDGANSKLKVGDSPIVHGDLDIADMKGRMYIGAYVPSGEISSAVFDGAISQIRAFKRAFSDEEVEGVSYLL